MKVWLVMWCDAPLAVCTTLERAEQAIRDDDMVPDSTGYTIDEMELLA
jgi:hypothetical protein